VSRNDGPGPELTARLGYLLKHAQYRMHELNDRALEPYGVDGRELGVLVLLASHEPSSQQQAAQRLGVDRTTMVALLDTLESKGLVSRHPHAEDRRRNVVELTQVGHKVVEKATKASDEAEREFLAPLSAEAAQRFRDALRLVVEDQA
jgi:DNA-binding MarR family transcriptional regulator